MLLGQEADRLPRRPCAQQLHWGDGGQPRPKAGSPKAWPWPRQVKQNRLNGRHWVGWHPGEGSIWHTPHGYQDFSHSGNITMSCPLPGTTYWGLVPMALRILDMDKYPDTGGKRFQHPPLPSSLLYHRQDHTGC